MTLAEYIARCRGQVAAAITARESAQNAVLDLRSRVEVGDSAVTRETIAAAVAERDKADLALDSARATLDSALAEQAREDEIAAQRAVITQTAEPAERGSRVHTGAEARTYSPESDPKGRRFIADVKRALIIGDTAARARLDRHTAQEVAERALQGQSTRAGVTSDNVAGTVIPQYLVDLYAPLARAARPFADACRSRDLPPTGMVVYLPKATTGTTVDEQLTELTDVSDTSYDDTLLAAKVRTNAGKQLVSYQAIDRGDSTEDTILEDLLGAYATGLDAKLLNTAATGLDAVATAVTFTSASPKVEELVSRLGAAAAAVEQSLLNQQVGATALVMSPARWWWLATELSQQHALVAQPNTSDAAIGKVESLLYGGVPRGFVAGLPVIVDANVKSNFGTGTDQDAIYVVALNECHLWEDPTSPLFIKTETGPDMGKLGVNMVLYGYFASLFNRYNHAHKITGTGLVNPFK
jgi:hypothetical protein